MQGEMNQYTCQHCFRKITTVDVDEGVTPFMVTCRATAGCTGAMHSQMYRNVPADAIATHEWYQPADPNVLSAGEREHVEKGGLLLRARPGFEPVVPTKERLAQVLEAANDRRLTHMVKKARAGGYDDFESESPTPSNDLVRDLRACGHPELAERAMAGEWDATADEAEAWAKRQDKLTSWLAATLREQGGRK